MKANFYIATIIFLVCPIIYADQITIYNKSNNDVWVAIYYYKKDPLERIGEPFLIKSQSTMKVARPHYQFLVDRYVLVDTMPAMLKQEVALDEMKKVLTMDIGVTNGAHFYINEVNGRLKGYHQLDWVMAPDREKVNVAKN